MHKTKYITIPMGRAIVTAKNCGQSDWIAIIRFINENTHSQKYKFSKIWCNTFDHQNFDALLFTTNK